MTASAARRGFLAGVAAFGLAPKAAAALPAGPAPHYGLGDPPGLLGQRVGMASVGREAVVSSSRARGVAFKAYTAARDAIWAEQNAQDELLKRLGGLPPHLASMRSCKPWFLHQRAMAWQRERQITFANLLVDLTKHFGSDVEEKF